MTRKRAKKLMMAAGVSRNDAEWLLNACRKKQETNHIVAVEGLLLLALKRAAEKVGDALIHGKPLPDSHHEPPVGLFSRGAK